MNFIDVLRDHGIGDKPYGIGDKIHYSKLGLQFGRVVASGPTTQGHIFTISGLTYGYAWEPANNRFARYNLSDFTLLNYVNYTTSTGLPLETVSVDVSGNLVLIFSKYSQTGGDYPQVYRYSPTGTFINSFQAPSYSTSWYCNSVVDPTGTYVCTTEDTRAAGIYYARIRKVSDGTIHATPQLADVNYSGGSRKIMGITKDGYVISQYYVSSVSTYYYTIHDLSGNATVFDLSAAATGDYFRNYNWVNFNAGVTTFDRLQWISDTDCLIHLQNGYTIRLNIVGATVTRLWTSTNPVNIVGNNCFRVQYQTVVTTPAGDSATVYSIYACNPLTGANIGSELSRFAGTIGRIHFCSRNNNGVFEVSGNIPILMGNASTGYIYRVSNYYTVQ